MNVLKATQAEIARMPAPIAGSAQAAAALELAHRLDDGPGDREAVGLARELRLALSELRRQVEAAPGGGDGLVDRIGVAALGD